MTNIQKRKKVYIDYNTIAEATSNMVMDIFSYDIEAIGIDVNGGQMLGMHIANLLKTPYSFITYYPKTGEPIWLGSEVQQKRILIVTDYNNKNSLRIKEKFEKRGKKVFFLTIVKDERSTVDPDFVVYDNTDKQQDIIMPWSPDYKRPNIEYKIQDELDDIVKTPTNKEVYEKVNDKGTLKGKTWWYVSKSSIKTLKVGYEDELTVVDIGENEKTWLKGRALISKIMQDMESNKCKNIVLEDINTSIVLSLMLKGVKVHVKIQGTLVCLDTNEVTLPVK